MQLSPRTEGAFPSIDSVSWHQLLFGLRGTNGPGLNRAKCVSRTHLLFKSCPAPVPRLLDTQGHDGVDDVIIVLLESLDSLFATDIGLGHDQLNILILKAFGLDLVVIVVLIFIFLLLLFLGLGSLDGLAGLAVVVAGVVLGTLGGELSSGGLLGGSVDVLDLGLTEDTAGMSEVLVEPGDSMQLTCRCCCWGTCRPRGC